MAASVRANSWKRARAFILWVIALVAVWRLIGLTVEFCGQSLQQDFSAFYTAGEALNHGLDPYQNHLNHEPPVWDGIDIFRHSRFLYPPLVATLFQPVALLPYKLAKQIWAIASLIFLAGSMILMKKTITIERGRDSWVIPVIIVFSALFYPLLTHLERGQIDTLTLFLFLLAVRDLISGRGWRAGILLALTTLFKLHSLYAVPFLLLQKKWKAVGGYSLGVVILVILSLLINGSLLGDYLFKEFPRIALQGERGSVDDLLPGLAVAQKMLMLQSRETEKDGSRYHAESFFFEQNASLVRILIPLLTPVLNLTQSGGSLLIFFVLFLTVALRVAGQRSRQPVAVDEPIYWQIVLIVILLAGPLTWAMNAVWLLPAAFLFVHPAWRETPHNSLWKALGIAALLLAAMPDQYAFPYVPLLSKLLSLKYVIAELMLFTALLVIMKTNQVNIAEEKSREHA